MYIHFDVRVSFTIPVIAVMGNAASKAVHVQQESNSNSTVHNHIDISLSYQYKGVYEKML